jgi:hypothetical protein
MAETENSVQIWWKSDSPLPTDVVYSLRHYLAAETTYGLISVRYNL